MKPLSGLRDFFRSFAFARVAWSADIKAFASFLSESEWSESLDSSVVVLSDCDSSSVSASAETKLARNSFLRALHSSFVRVKNG